MAKFRLVVAGLVHDHVWGMLPGFAKHPAVTIVGGADPHRPLRERLAREYGVTATFANWRDLFSRVRADAVLVCTTNAGAAPVVEAAAARGLDAMVEKPMAATADQARRMLRAARRHGTRLMINWPTAWSPPLRRAMEMVEGGDLGHVFHAKVHMAHQGPKEAGCSPYFYGWLYDRRENGGGAIIDYCGYGAAIFAAMWGRPSQVFGAARTLVKRRFPVDDNAMLTVLYERRMVLTQASWTQNPDHHDSVFLGDEATLATDRGRLLMSWTPPAMFHHWGADRIRRKEIRTGPLPAAERSGPAHFVHRLLTGKPFLKLCRPETGVIAQEILTAGVVSERTGRRVSLRG